MLLSSEKVSQELGRKIAMLIHPPLTLFFSGALGVGKTTMIRSILQALGVKESIKSPTFSTVESYSVDINNTIVRCHHFDLYRIQSIQTLHEIGFRDYFDRDSICFVEWPERAENIGLTCDILFDLQHKQNQRTLQMLPYSTIGEKILGHFSSHFSGHDYE